MRVFDFNGLQKLKLVTVGYKGYKNKKCNQLILRLNKLLV